MGGQVRILAHPIEQGGSLSGCKIVTVTGREFGRYPQDMCFAWRKKGTLTLKLRYLNRKRSDRLDSPRSDSHDSGDYRGMVH